MALSRALLAQREQLQYYQGAADTPGLPERLAALLGDMKKSRSYRESLEAHAQSLPPGPPEPRKATEPLWQAYDQLLAGRFVDGESTEEEGRSGACRAAA
jgi:ATP-dependent helicase/DNAse subunit B